MENDQGNIFSILVVDDTPQLLQSTARLLRSVNYEVFSASNGAECMRLLSSKKPDIILLDVMLPEINGTELCRRIKEQPDFSSIYVMLFSSVQTSAEEISEGLEAGADGFINLPSDKRELLARVNAACRIIATGRKTHDNEMLLKACIDSPDDIIVLAIDKDYNYLAFNAYHRNIMLKAYGTDIKQGMNLLDGMSNQEDKSKAMINYSRAFSGESHISVEEFGELDRQYYETRYNPIYNDNGQIIGATAFAANVTERIRIEESLKKSEEKFRKVFITSPDSININRLSDGMYISVNYGFTDITGYREKEVIGKTSLEIDIWADPSVREILVTGLKNNGNVKNLETRFKMKNGQLRYGLMSAILIELDNIPHILSVTRDITEQKEIENAYKHSVTRYKELIELAPDGILLGSHDGKITEANSRIHKLTGRPSCDLIGYDIEILFSEDELNKVPLRYDLLNQGLTIINERILLRSDGNEIPVEMHTKMMPDGSYHSIVHDISDRKKAEQEIRKIGEHYRALIEKAPDGFVLLDSDGKFKFISPSARRIFGYDKTDQIPEDPAVFTHPDDLPKILAEIAKLIEHPDYFPTLQYRFTNKTGEWKWVETTFSNFLDDEAVGSIVLNFRDITDRKQAEKSLIETAENLQRELEKKHKAEIALIKSHKKLEKSKLATVNLLEDIKLEMEQRMKAEEELSALNDELEKHVIERTSQLEEANKELSAFAYSVSHDLRAPLRAIDGFSKFALEDYGNKLDKEGLRLLTMIRANTQKMDKLITDILALSRVTRSEHKLSRVDMTKMAGSMYNEVSTPEIKTRLRITINVLPEVFADSVYLKQVWINLISNAIKFSSGKANPEITIDGYYENGFNVYYVQDNGVGFNPEYSHKLFGVFQRLHKADEFEGTGVGLAIVQRIILRHGGKVWAEGAENLGAKFYFSLPVKGNS